MNRLPDFIIIGAMKCATSTLHEQLARQPGIFMSTPKEPCFFSDDTQWERGESWYESLFRDAAATDLCGESSTHYTKLPTHSKTVARMKQLLPPNVKFIYVMRHPIDRLISQYIHEWTQRVISSPIDQAVDNHPELVAYSMYSVQLDPYCIAFGEGNILPVFFERLARHPQTELERICQFIGYHRLPRWHDDVGEENKSSDRLRHNALRDAIINLPGLKQARRALVPKAAREWVKGFWSMKQRPQLSPSVLERLTGQFDRDLSRLGNWFGLDLTCRNFKEVASNSEPVWRSRAEATST